MVRASGRSAGRAPRGPPGGVAPEEAVVAGDAGEHARSLRPAPRRVPWATPAERLSGGRQSGGAPRARGRNSLPTRGFGTPRSRSLNRPRHLPGRPGDPGSRGESPGVPGVAQCFPARARQLTSEACGKTTRGGPRADVHHCSRAQARGTVPALADRPGVQPGHDRRRPRGLRRSRTPARHARPRRAGAAGLADQGRRAHRRRRPLRPPHPAQRAALRAPRGPPRRRPLLPRAGPRIAPARRARGRRGGAAAHRQRRAGGGRPDGDRAGGRAARGGGAIAAANRITRKPYRYGGGHGRFEDSAYDCSGAVSYVLHGAGLLERTRDSIGLHALRRARRGELDHGLCPRRACLRRGGRPALRHLRARAKEGPRWRPEPRARPAATPSAIRRDL